MNAKPSANDADAMSTLSRHSQERELEDDAREEASSGDDLSERPKDVR